MIDSSVIEAYVERIYVYAIKRTFTRQEADDLSQEILLNVLQNLHRLQREDRFEPFIWGIAANVTQTYRRKKGKERALFCYDFSEELVLEEDAPQDHEQTYAVLRQHIAMLSAMYRDIIILHYYDGLSVEQISAKLKIPEGTVKWRLSEARRKLKKECTNMEKSALRPVRMQSTSMARATMTAKRCRSRVLISTTHSHKIFCIIVMRKLWA